MSGPPQRCEHQGSEHGMALVALAIASQALSAAYETGGKRSVVKRDAQDTGADALDLVESALHWFQARCPTFTASHGTDQP